MQVPTPADVIAAYPQFGWADRGYPAGAALQDLVDEAIGYVAFITARPIDETMPAALAPTAKRAIVLRTAQDVLFGGDDYAEAVNDDAIQSFSIGPYSETRRTPVRGSRYAAQGLPTLNEWSALNQLLWMLLTEVPGESNPGVVDRRQYWIQLESGVNAPAFALQEVDWTNGRSGRGTLLWGLPEPTVDVPDPIT